MDEATAGVVFISPARRCGPVLETAQRRLHKLKLSACGQLTNIAFNDRVTAYQLHRQLNRDLSQAPKAPPPAAIINLTERARHLIINRFTRFNSLKPDTIDLTSRTKPHQKSLATAVPTTAAPARNPGAGNQLVNGRVNDVHKKAEHSPEVDHPHYSSGPQKRQADEDTVLDHER
ncbi:MAG: hypothetical protein LQ344_002997 [Seirophora lacunosa]|nr:MAG: hypothetical protein LQ344_002997 [Seirophora lacunosa]